MTYEILNFFVKVVIRNAFYNTIYLFYIIIHIFKYTVLSRAREQS